MVNIICIFIILVGLYLLISGLFLSNQWKRKVPYTKLTKEVILFCGDILHEKKIKRYPSYRIYYHKHKKLMGMYTGQEIVIYVNCHQNGDIMLLVDTILHEIAHYIQHQKDTNYHQYHKLTEKHGYEKNPFEVDARRFAAKHTAKCLTYLESRNCIG